MPNDVVYLGSEQLLALMMSNLSAGFTAGWAGAEGGKEYTHVPDDETLAELRDHAIKIIEMAKKKPAPQH